MSRGSERVRGCARTITTLALLALAAGCTCNKKNPTTTPPPAWWLEGKLPPEASSGTPTPGGTLRVRVSVEPAGLTRIHDRMSEGTMVRYTVGPIYETLGRIDRANPSAPLQPGLAEKWVESADHLSLAVTLKRGVTFHDGTPFTSRDVAATVAAIRDAKNPTGVLRSYFADLDALETPDDATVLVRWKKPYFLASWTFLAAIPVMPAKHLEGDFDTLPIHRAPIGTGPFKFEKWDTGSSLSMVRFDGYHGEKALLDRVVIRFVRDDVVAAQLFERGELDLLTRAPAAAWKALESDPAAFSKTWRVATADNAYYWIGWNERNPRFQDARVRRALAMAYPADVVAKVIDLGLEPRTTCPYYQSSQGCDPSVTPLPFDVAKAAALLDEAGWRDTNGDGTRERDGVELAFAFLTTSSSVKFGKLLPLYQERLAQVGAKASIERIDASVFMSRMRAHEFDAATLSWSTPDAVQDIYDVFHSSQAATGSNFVGYSSPEVDRRLEQIRATFDVAERTTLEREVHRLLYDDQVYLFLTLRPQLELVRPSVRGLVPSIAWYDLSRLWLAR